MADVTTATYDIPDLVLGDTFYEWLSVTNDKVIRKLNLMEVYTITGIEGISASANVNGQIDIALSNEIPHGITFLGDVRFNGTITKINSVVLTVDDYNLVLGAIGESDAGTSDYNIGQSGGGGLLITRLLNNSTDPGATVEWMWRGFSFGSGATYPNTGIGSSGSWNSTDYISLTGGVGVLSTDNTFRFKTGSSSVKPDGPGFMLTTASGPSSGQGAYTGDSMKMSHMGTGGVGTTHGIYFDEDGMVRIYDGVNKKLVTQASHGLTFGNSVRLGTGPIGWTLANANSKEEAEVFGMVSEVLNTSQFVVTTQGEIHGDFNIGAVSGGLCAGAVYFLSTGSTYGLISSIESVEAGKIRKPMMLGMGLTSGYVFQYVGARIAAETDSSAPTMRRISIGADGTLQHSSNTSLTGAKEDTGEYIIHHGFGTGNYCVNVSVHGLTPGWGVIGVTGDNSCEIHTRNASGTKVDMGIDVLLAKDVT